MGSMILLNSLALLKWQINQLPSQSVPYFGDCELQVYGLIETQCNFIVH